MELSKIQIGGFYEYIGCSIFEHLVPKCTLLKAVDILPSYYTNRVVLEYGNNKTILVNESELRPAIMLTRGVTYSDE